MSLQKHRNKIYFLIIKYHIDFFISIIIYYYTFRFFSFHQVSAVEAVEALESITEPINYNPEEVRFIGFCEGGMILEYIQPDVLPTYKLEKISTSNIEFKDILQHVDESGNKLVLFDPHNHAVSMLQIIRENVLPDPLTVMMDTDKLKKDIVEILKADKSQFEWLKDADARFEFKEYFLKKAKQDFFIGDNTSVEDLLKQKNEKVLSAHICAIIDTIALANTLGKDPALLLEDVETYNTFMDTNILEKKKTRR